jgi:YtoQ family protein
MQITVYLSGEVHSDWREQIVQGIRANDLPIDVLAPVTDHTASDNVGLDILGPDDDPFWKDHKAAKINSMRIKTAIVKSDLVVVKFGEKYRQWNAAFEAGYAVGKDKPLIVIHPAEFRHALKEVDASAMAVAETSDQVIQILKYVSTKK